MVFKIILKYYFIASHLLAKPTKCSKNLSNNITKPNRVYKSAKSIRKKSELIKALQEELNEFILPKRFCRCI